MRYERYNETFIRSTASLDSKEMTDFIEWIRNLAGRQGIDMPSADQYFRNWQEIENTVERHKTWI